MSVDHLCRLSESHMSLLLSLPRQFRPGTYVKRLGGGVATCYTGKRGVMSQRGFENHSDANTHFPVPEESAAVKETEVIGLGDGVGLVG